MQTVNPLLANALNVLQRGNTELAEKEFTKAVSACLAAFGETDIVTVRTLAHLARVCRLQGKVDVASQMYERILRIHEALPEPLNCDHAVALGELATIREEGGSKASADSLRWKADRIMAELGSRAQASQSSEDEEEGSSDYSEGDEEEKGSPSKRPIGDDGGRGGCCTKSTADEM